MRARGALRARRAALALGTWLTGRTGRARRAGVARGSTDARGASRSEFALRSARNGAERIEWSGRRRRARDDRHRSDFRGAVAQRDELVPVDRDAAPRHAALHRAGLGHRDRLAAPGRKLRVDVHHGRAARWFDHRAHATDVIAWDGHDDLVVLARDRGAGDVPKGRALTQARSLAGAVDDERLGRAVEGEGENRGTRSVRSRGARCRDGRLHPCAHEDRRDGRVRSKRAHDAIGRADGRRSLFVDADLERGPLDRVGKTDKCRVSSVG